MRTTIMIDDDVLVAAKAIARRQGRPVGGVISDLARRALLLPKPKEFRNGVPLLSGNQPITLDVVNALRDELTA